MGEFKMQTEVAIRPTLSRKALRCNQQVIQWFRIPLTSYQQRNQTSLPEREHLIF